MDALDEARRRFPVGSQVEATVSHIPNPGVIGVFLDFDEDLRGFIDVLHLPAEKESWPVVGTALTVEVLQHRPGQVRLWPVDSRWRGHHEPWLGQATWDLIKSNCAVGDRVTAMVTHVYKSNREYVVQFDDATAVVEWYDAEPTVGDVAQFEIHRLLDTTRRILLQRLS